MLRSIGILCCLAIAWLSAAGVWAASKVEMLSDDLCVVRSDNGNWGGEILGITHQRDPDYQARKILDLGQVPQAAWNRATQVRLSVWFTVRDYSGHDLPKSNGLDQPLEIIINGQTHRYPTGARLPVYDESKPEGTRFRWHDFALAKEDFVRGRNEIVFRLAKGSKSRSDDYLYLGIDNTVPPGDSYVRFAKGDPWRQDRLTQTGGKGEYMVRLCLVGTVPPLEATWSPRSGELRDTAGVLQYAGSHGGPYRVEWHPESFDRLTPITVTAEMPDDHPLAIAWLGEGKQPLPPPIQAKGPRFEMTLGPQREFLPSGVQIESSAIPVRLSLRAARSFHPLPRPIDMTPPMRPASGAEVPRQPSCRIETDAILLANGNLRCLFEPVAGHLRLASLYNELTATEMVRRPDDVALFLVEVAGARYAGRDFQCQKISPLTGRQGFSAVLQCPPLHLEAELSVWIDDALRMGLKLANRGSAAIEFKAAFPHMAGLAVSNDPPADYYFFPWGGGIIADSPALIRRGYGDHEALYGLVDLFSPARGGGLAISSLDTDGRHKVLAVRKHVPGQQEFLGDAAHTPTADEYLWHDSLPQVPGTAVTFEYLRRTRRPGESLAVPDVAIRAHAGDWRVPMRAYAQWCHEAWKFRPYPSRLKAVINMIDAGWGQSPLVRDGKYRTDFIQPRCDVIELMSWWEWAPLGPWRTPWDKLEARIGAATYAQYRPYWVKDPVTGKTMYPLNRGDYDGYNQRWGGLPALREAIATYRRMGTLATLYTDPILADDNTECGKRWGQLWGIVNPDGRYRTSYESWNMCHDVAEYRQFVAQTMGRVLRETGADGIRLDEYGHAGSACFSTRHQHTFAEQGTTQWQRAIAETTKMVRQAMDEVNPAAVLTTEHPGYDYLMQYLEGSLTYDLTVQATPLRPLECNLQRFYFPECKAYELDHRGADLKHRKRFWNAVGSFGSYYPLAYDRILRENQDLFASRQCEPLVPTMARQVYVNRFQDGPKTIFTIYNATGHTFFGPVLSLRLRDDERLVDLLHASQADCQSNGSDTTIRVFLPPDEVTCLVQLPKRLHAKQLAKTLDAGMDHPCSDSELVVCDSTGQPLVTAPAGAATSFKLAELPPGAKPAAIKLLVKSQLVDIVPLAENQ